MKRVLIVDDDPLFTRLMSEFCATYGGLSCYALSDSLDVVRYIQDNDISLVFLDVVMERKNGLSVLGDLGMYCPNTTVIVVSGEQAYLEVADRLGAHGTIQKPVYYDQFKRVIDEHSTNRTNSSITSKGL